MPVRSFRAALLALIPAGMIWWGLWLLWKGLTAVTAGV